MDQSKGSRTGKVRGDSNEKDAGTNSRFTRLSSVLNNGTYRRQVNISYKYPYRDSVVSSISTEDLVVPFLFNTNHSKIIRV